MLTEMDLRNLGLGHEARERFIANIAAAAGAAVLDSKNSEWYRKIDTGKLRQDTTSECILGQLYGDHMEGVHGLGLTGDMDEILGFVCPARTHTTMLNAAWSYEVQRRLTAKQ